MTVTAEMVRTLRGMTGAGMMECKSALVEAEGDLEAAVDRLKARGIVKAARKSDRIASDGLVGIAVDGKRGALVEVNSETDFVARNDRFQGLVARLAGLAMTVDGDVEALRRAEYDDGVGVDEELANATATIGERIVLRRAAMLSVSEGVVVGYVHNAVRPGMGRIGVLVALESKGDVAVLEALGKQIAMHVANTRPVAISPEEVPADLVERERRIFREQASASGKPADIVEKMVDGRVRRYLEEIALTEQTSVIDGRTRISELLHDAGKSAGASVSIGGFVCFVVGESVPEASPPAAPASMASA